MTIDVHFHFMVDKEAHTITIVRDFAARRQLVWDCYTKAELLDRWFAPKPLVTKTNVMDFREGGHWHYAMVAPDGTEYWSRLDYLTLRPIDGFTALDGFSDATGALNPELPRSHWDVGFSEMAEHCRVRTIVAYDSLEDIEKVVQMGVEAGMASTFERLDELLVALGRE